MYGKKSLLYAGCGIGRNDFHLRAKLSVCSEDDKPHFVVGTNNIGISGFQRLSYVFWPCEVLGHQQMALSSDWVTPGVPFNFEIVRKGTRVVIIVDGTAVKHFLFGGELTRFGFCSYEGTLRIHDFYVRGETIPLDWNRTQPIDISVPTIDISDEEGRQGCRGQAAGAISRPPGHRANAGQQNDVLYLSAWAWRSRLPAEEEHRRWSDLGRSPTCPQQLDDRKKLSLYSSSRRARRSRAPDCIRGQRQYAAVDFGG